jgi:hypothetical protein
MILNIKDKEYPLPEKVGYERWKKLMNYDYNDPNEHREIISYAFNIPIEDANMIPDNTLELGLLFLYGKLFPPKSGNHTIINLNNLTMGDFIDLEILYSKGMVKNSDEIIKKLYPSLNKLPEYIDEVWWGILAYFNYRKNIFIKYKNLFDIPDSDEEVQEDKNPTPPEYLWWEVIMILANNEFLKIDEVVKKPLFQSLNYLAWDKDKKQKELNAIRNSKV